MKGQFFPYADTVKTRKFPFLTTALIAVNAIIFLWSTTNFNNIIFTFGFIPALFPSIHGIITLFTSMFLHGGFDHIFGNMWYLWIFGDNIEEYFGEIRFVIIYLLSGSIASLFQYITDPVSSIPSIGASGAISGILGAYFILYPKSRIITALGYNIITLPASIVIGFWFAIQLLFGTISLVGYSGSNIAFFAHIGGFLAGMFLAYISKKSKRK